MGIYQLRTEFGHHFKYILIGIAFIFVVGAFFTFGAGPMRRQAGPGGQADDVVATVGGLPITRADMDATWQQAINSLRDSGMRSSLQMAQARSRVFQSLVDQRITLVSAKAMGVEINQRDVDAKLDQMVVDYLKENRRSVLGGKLSADREKLDPRQDSEYKTELGKSVGQNGAPMTVGTIEEQARMYLPKGQIEYQLAQEGIRKAIKAKAGNVSDQDIANSYNVYGLRQIVILKSSLPADQLKTRVDKIESQAKGGGDFAALAKQNTIDPMKGAIQSVSYGSVSPEVWDQLGKLKPGEVSNPIDTDQLVYIVKVESVKPQLPAKADPKATDQRRGMISNMREMQEYMKYDGDVRRKLVVDVTDPELLGYYHLNQLRQAGGNPGEAKKQISLAASAFKKSIAKEPNNQYSTAMLAVILKEQGDAKQAMAQLYHLLEGPDAKGEGADLRIMLGDMLMQTGEKAKAATQYAKAAEAAGADANAHKDLIARFKQIGRADLSSKEQAWLVQYEANKKAYEAQQRKNGPQGAPPPAP